jgi:hypothetical protein
MSERMKKESMDALQIAPLKEESDKYAEGLSLDSSLVYPGLTPILEARYREAQHCLTESPLATIILCGSLLEGLLFGLAKMRPEDFNRSRCSPKDKNGKPKPFYEWSPAEFINVAYDLRIIRLDVKKFGSHLRDFRNYIHPYKQMREEFYPDKYTAEMCLLTVKATIHNLLENPNEKQKEISTNWGEHTDATYLILATLIGSWNEKYTSDIEAVTEVLSISYDSWLQKGSEILNLPDSPLSLKNGIWKLVNRDKLLQSLGSRILDQNLSTFKTVAAAVLKENDPAFELPVEERYAASIHGKVLKHSHELRKGIAEGLAIIGSLPDVCSNCSQGKVETTCGLVVREVLNDANWVLWGSVNDLLPFLAEAHPDEFLNEVNKALLARPCPFDELFQQESNGITGRNYLTGLLWALEALAWDERYLVRASVALCELAKHDLGGAWANRPLDSLVTILLPWFPQTLASVEKRKVVVTTLLKECPDTAWNLLIRLLPGQKETIFDSYKPSFRKKIPDDWGKEVSKEEFLDQVSFYAELLVSVADHNTVRLSELIDRFNNLPQPAFNQLIEILSSKTISELPEEQRLLLWDHLKKFTNKHKRFADAEWALPGELIARIEDVSKLIAPKNLFYLYQHLFTDRDGDLFDEAGDFKDQRKQLTAKREKAIEEIFTEYGFDGVIRFAESVDSPQKVGYALGALADDLIEQRLLPDFLDLSSNNYKALVDRFIWRRQQLNGWDWCDNIDKSEWAPEQIGSFLACLPFTKETWDRAVSWLGEQEREYWSRTNANAYESAGDLSVAIEKLLNYGRPFAAINCLGRMLFEKQSINLDQCVRALFSAISSDEPTYLIEDYDIVELIKLLQSEPSIDQENLLKLEWAYLPLLDDYRGGKPKILENKLADDPSFFCEVVQMIYPSTKENRSEGERPEEKKAAIARNAFRLLNEWKKVPGTKKDGTFNETDFNRWLQSVKQLCIESGHLEVAMKEVGKILVHAPSDPEGLWIHHAIAGELNTSDAEEMRRGYLMGTYNLRGAHWVDPMGKPEKELAEQCLHKAEALENNGFHRFAVTLRKLAEDYEQDAERIIAEHQQDEL